jgi:hypothetical protein
VTLCLRIDTVAADRASVAIGVRELCAEAVAQIGCSAVAQVESLVLLDQGPLEAVDGIAFE